MTFDKNLLNLDNATEIDLNPKIDGVQVWIDAGYGDVTKRNKQTIYFEVTGGLKRHIFQVNARAKFNASQQSFAKDPYLSYGGLKPVSFPEGEGTKLKKGAKKTEKWTFLHDGSAHSKDTIWLDETASAIAGDDGKTLRFFDRPKIDYQNDHPFFLMVDDWAKFLAYTFIVRDAATVGVVKWSIKQNRKNTDVSSIIKAESKPVTKDIIDIGRAGIMNHGSNSTKGQLGFWSSDTAKEMAGKLPDVK